MIDDGRTGRRHDRRGPALRCRAAHGRARPGRDHIPAADRPGGAGPLLTAEVVETRGRAATVAVAGEIDLQTADLLRDRLLDLADAGYRTLVVDFGAVVFCDAAGLGALVAAHNRVASAGGEIRLAAVRPAQRKLLRVTGLHRVFPLDDGPGAALGGPSVQAAFPRG